MLKIKFLGIYFSFVCLYLFNSCGLDTYYVLNRPTDIYHEPSIPDTGQDSEYSQSYFDFRTNDDNELGGDFKYIGTLVYYKIYNNYSDMNNHISVVSNISNNTNSSEAFPKLESYGYKQLVAKSSSGRAERLTIEPSGSGQRIYIRLTNYKEYFTAKIVIGAGDNGTVLEGSTEYEPLRYEGNKNFDFGRKNSKGDYDKPESTDSDVYYSSTASEENIYYVTLYAVAAGQDSSLTTYYSNVLYLGSVKINASVEDN